MARRHNDSPHPPDIRPLDVDGVRTVAIVTVGWGVAFVGLALRQGQLNDAGNGWWLWTCLAGVGLGLLGLEYCRKRRDAIAQAALEAEADDDEVDDDSGVGDWSRLPPEEDEPDVFADQYPPPYDQQPAADGDHVTQPYQHADPQPGHTTGDMPAVPGHAGTGAGHGGQPAYGQGPYRPSEYSEPHAPAPAPSPVEPYHSQPAPPPGYHEPAPQRPVERPRPQPAPLPAPAPQRQPSMPASAAPSRPADRRSTPQQQPQPPAQQPTPPPASASRQPTPPPASASRQPAPQPEPAPQDPYSTGAGWYDSAAGYTPDADQARTHPRDRRPETSQPTGPAAEPPPAGSESERPSRHALEDSEFFGTGSSKPPPNSTAEFLLADLADEDEEQQAPPSRHDRDAPDDEYRGRRARHSR